MPANRAVSYCNFLHTQIALLYSVCAADDKGAWDMFVDVFVYIEATL